MKTKTYQDLITAQRAGTLADWVFQAITAHTTTADYKTAQDAERYAAGENVTITDNQKFIYSEKFGKIPDTFSANHKVKSGFFKLFTVQEVSYLLKNGVSFENDATKEKLGKNFDRNLYQAALSALTQKVCYGFVDYNKVRFFKYTNFVPVLDETDGSLKAGIWFWRLDTLHPEHAVLFTPNGFTKFVNDGKPRLEEARRDYRQTVKSSATGQSVEPGGNYNGNLPIVPLWGNNRHKSELVPIRDGIDAYDLVQSGFVNDISNIPAIYWRIENAGGMHAEDALRFKAAVKKTEVALVGPETKVGMEKTEIPYASRDACLERLKRDLYESAMALDINRLSAGAVTATHIQAAYEPLEQKSYELKTNIEDFIAGVLDILGIDDKPTIKPARVSNITEMTQAVLMMAPYVDAETILRHLPLVEADEIDDILKRKANEEAERLEEE